MENRIESNCVVSKGCKEVPWSWCWRMNRSLQGDLGHNWSGWMCLPLDVWVSFSHHEEIQVSNFATSWAPFAVLFHGDPCSWLVHLKHFLTSTFAFLLAAKCWGRWIYLSLLLLFLSIYNFFLLTRNGWWWIENQLNFTKNMLWRINHIIFLLKRGGELQGAQPLGMTYKLIF